MYIINKIFFYLNKFEIEIVFIIKLTEFTFNTVKTNKLQQNKYKNMNMVKTLFFNQRQNEGPSDVDTFYDAKTGCIKMWDSTKNDVLEWGCLKVSFGNLSGKRGGTRKILIEDTNTKQKWHEGNGYMVYLHDGKLYHVAGRKNNLTSRKILEKPRDKSHRFKWESGNEAKRGDYHQLSETRIQLTKGG